MCTFTHSYYVFLLITKITIGEIYSISFPFFLSDNNAIKYAFPHSEKGKVLIKLEKSSTGILRLEVTDNGIGKSGVIQGTGFGGQLISLLTRQLNGTMKESNNNGTQVIFDFAQLKSA
jgi:two-component sensor histidine kinase